MTIDDAFKQKYGPNALIAGGAQGIGAAYARYLAERGLNVVILDVCSASLNSLSAELTQQHGVQCVPVEVDLASPDLLQYVIEQVGDLEVGLLIYNAALADLGPFYKEEGLALELRRLAVNVTGPLVLTHHFARPMLARRAGGVILVSSGAGFQGGPYNAHYAATKAYSTILGESLWGEFKAYNVDVLSCVAGMTLSSAAQGFEHMDTSGFQTPEELVQEAMTALGSTCTLVAGDQQREMRRQIKDLSRDEQVSLMSEFMVGSFWGGRAPDQHL